MYFSFIWKGNGYKRQTDNLHYIAVWNKLWRRNFIGNTRFTDRPNWSDADFDRMMEQKHGERVYADLLVYYYNYMYKDSINDRYARGFTE